MDLLNNWNPLELLFLIPALTAAITIHEFAHALAADRLGDPTPRLQGRLTLNPLKHLHPIGTLMLILFRFGWGKPVQFDPYNLENPRRDAALISFAGPAANLSLALVASILTKLALSTGFYNDIAVTFGVLLIGYNVFLAVFNLIPIHPLDGGKILIGLLPPRIANDWDRILNEYGFIMLIVLILPIFGDPLVYNLLNPTLHLLLNLLLPASTDF